MPDDQGEVATLLHEAVRSELIYMLVKLDRDYTALKPSEPWERYYANELIEHVRAGS
ncbi:MAG TPA: hypothetical protein VIO62_03740 [Candidatus Dormibacteraeota bacterium]|jgi:hypothetical protein